MTVRAWNCRNATFSEKALEDYRKDLEVEVACALERAQQLEKERNELLAYAEQCRQKLASSQTLRNSLTETLKLFN